ncbi:MAG: Tetratricopeptide repeat [Candidatus Eisenbacteria bacterium]
MVQRGDVAVGGGASRGRARQRAPAGCAFAHLAWLSPLAGHAPLLPEWSAPATPWAWAAWGALALWTVAVLVAIRRRSEWTLPLVLLVAPLLPVAGASLLETGARFAERALVLPAAGAALACATLAAGVPATQRRLVATLLALFVCLQGLAATRAIGAWRDEESRIRRIAEVRPDDPDAVLGMADLLSAQGRTEEAARWLSRADSLPGASVAVLTARATAAFRAGAPAQALAAAEAALARAPDDLGAGVVRVRALVRLGRVDEAVAGGESLMRAHPGAPAAGGATGVAYLAANRVPEARDLLAAASAVLLEDAGLAWDLGRAAISSGDVSLARTAFERAVAAEPGFVEAWLGVADTRARLGDRAGAEVALERAEAIVGEADPRLVALRARIGGR